MPDRAARCANCGAALAARHCGECGQAAHIHRTLSAIWHDALHGLLHVEGRVWRTLGLLAVRPGELTRRYIAGERTRFIGPFALFLFAIFLAYVILTSLPGPQGTETMSQAERALLADYRASLDRLAAESRADGLDADDKANLAAQEAIIRRLAAPLAAKSARLSTDRQATQAAADQLKKGGAEAIFTVDGKLVIEAAEPVARGGGDGTVVIDPFDPALDRFHWVDEIAGETGLDVFSQLAGKMRSSPGLLAYKLQTTAYKYAFILIPLSTLATAALFLWRRRRPLYDHYVFATYGLSAATFLLVLLMLAGALVGLPGASVAAFVALLPIHLFVQLRGAYGLSRLSAGWRTLILVAVGAANMLMFILGLTAFGALG